MNSFIEVIKRGQQLSNTADKKSWDDAVKACIRITVVDACGFPGPQVDDMTQLLHDKEWHWQDDEELKELLEW